MDITGATRDINAVASLLAVFKDIQLFLVDSFNHSDVQVAKSGADAKARLVSLDFKMWIEYLSQIRQAEGLCNQKRPAPTASPSEDAGTPPGSADDKSNMPPDPALGHASATNPGSPVPSSARPELDSHDARNLDLAGVLRFPLYAELIPVIEDLQAISQSRKGVLSNEDLRRDALSWAGHLCSVQNSLLHGQFKTATDILRSRIGLPSLPEQLIDIERRIALATATDADMAKELDELVTAITTAVQN
jgi:hypothetical protein